MERKSGVNPWIIIFFASTLFFALSGFLFFRWFLVRKDTSQIATQLIKRQNAVLAHDTVSVARELSHLLENAARDVQALSLIPTNSEAYTKFYLAHISQITRTDPYDESMGHVPLPIYNELIALNVRGDEILRLKNGRPEPRLRRRAQCVLTDLCDPKLLEEGMKLSVGEVYYGRVVRFYTRENEPAPSDEGAMLPILYRGHDALFLLGIDYRYFKELLLEPTFPYERKRNLLQAYQNGNYIYFVDDTLDFIAHPKPWHVAGIDKKTGQYVPPIREDSDEGSRPLNVKAYRGAKLKNYFDRLLKKSFVQRGVDIFEASNLQGTSRVLSVSPILLSKGQFRRSGVFGYTVLGCNVDYFEEPREQYVPYY